MWPVELVPVPCYGDAGVWFSLCFRTKSRRPVLFPASTWDNLVGLPFEWKSPAWLSTHFPLAPHAWTCAVRAIVRRPVNGDEPLKAVIARMGWFDWDLATMTRVAQLIREDIPGDARTLLQVLLALTTKVLGISEDDAIDILKRRLALRDKSPAVEELLELDEGGKLMLAKDEEDLRKEQRRQTDTAERLDEFAREYRELMAGRRAAAKAAEKAQAKRGARAAPRPRLPGDAVINISEANRWKPPGSYVWRAWTKNAWQGRVPPHATVNRPWSKFGTSAAAFRSLICELWKQYCADQSIEPANCPMLGVF